MPESSASRRAFWNRFDSAAIAPRNERLYRRLAAGAGRWPLALAAAAALLVCLGGFALWSSREQSPAAVARLEAVHGEVYIVTDEHATPAVAGQGLRAGQSVRTVGEESSATVRFPDATRLELSLNTSIRVDRADTGPEVFLTEGLLTAESAQRPAGRPMVVDTAEAKVTLPEAADKTRFSLSNAPGSLHVELESGSVAVKRKRDGKSVRLKTGEQVLITAEDEPLAARPLPPRLTARATLLGRHSEFITSLAFSPDGKTLASGGLDAAVTFWDVAARRQRDLLSTKARVSSVFFSVDGQTIAVVSATLDAGAGSAVAELLALPERKQLAAFPAVAHVHELRTAVFSPDGQALASVDSERNIHLWDIAR